MERKIENVIGIYHYDYVRWHTPDPAEQFSNPYLAMGNNPVMYVDPNGEFVITSAIIIGAMIGSFTGAVAAGYSGASNGQIMASFGIGAFAGAVSGGVADKFVGAGFIGGAIQGGSAGFTGGFINSAGNAFLNGSNFGEGIAAGFKGGGIGALSGAAIGGTVNGFKAHKAGLDFMSGGFKSKDDAINFFKNALASKDGIIMSIDLPQIDLSSDDITKEFRELFQYLDNYGEYGYSIDELIDLNTNFDKSFLKEISDGFFGGPFASKSNTFNIEFTNTNFAGKVKVGYWPDKSLISGGFSYSNTASWHSLRLDSTTGGYMLELSLSNRALYNHYIYSYMSMNANNIK